LQHCANCRFIILIQNHLEFSAFLDLLVGLCLIQQNIKFILSGPKVQFRKILNDFLIQCRIFCCIHLLVRFHQIQQNIEFRVSGPEGQCSRKFEKILYFNDKTTIGAMLQEDGIHIV